MWLIVRSLKEKSKPVNYMIQKSEIIKLGRMKFWVKEFATETEHFENDAKCEYYDVVTLNEVNHNLENF